MIDEWVEYYVDMSLPNAGFLHSHSPVLSPNDNNEHDSEPDSPSHSCYHRQNESVGEGNHLLPRLLPQGVFVNCTLIDNFNSGMGTNSTRSSSYMNELS